MSELSALEKRFVDEYSVSHDAQNSALKAGYSEKFAQKKSYQLVERPAIKRQLEDTRQLAFTKAGITYQWKVDKLKRVIDQTIPSEGHIDHKRAKVGIAAMAELNKLAGDYAPEKRLSMTVDMTKAKLLEAKKIYEEF